MMQDIQNAARARYGSIRRLALTMTRHTGDSRVLSSLASWRKPAAKTSNYDPTGGRREWISEYLGVAYREATEQQRREGLEAYKAR